MSYDSNLGSKILILAGDIRSRSWPTISGTYGIYEYRNLDVASTRLRLNCVQAKRCIYGARDDG